MRARRFLPIFLLLTAGALAQNSLPVTFLQDSTRNTRIGMFVNNGVVYASLNNIARTFRIDTYRNEETQTFELRTATYSISVAADNPFIVIADQKKNGSIIQLPMAIRFAANSFFVPIEQFIQTINYVVPEEVTYDATRQMLTVGRTHPVSRYDIAGLDFEEKSNGLLVKIQCTKKLSDYESWLKTVGDDTWLYITIANARADIAAIGRIKPTGFVQKILIFQSPTSVQLTIRVRGQMNSVEMVPAQEGNTILAALHPSTQQQVSRRKEREYTRNLERERNRWKLDVVVIDAGHGGKDPGTIGVGKTREKDVTLSIALKLGNLIRQRLPDVKVVYTRKTDEFVELYRRGQIANQAGGKLFISIHCNSAQRKPHPANGFEIYLLRPGKTENALRIAERENEVVKLEEAYERRYQQLTEENFILLTMAQSAYVKYSEQFADILQKEMGRNLELENNGVKQAGFYVLVGASMPNVLVETGYLSNKSDEQILKSKKQQARIAEALFNGVKKYKLEYERSLQEGKEIGSESK